MTEHLTMNTVVHAAFRRTIARFETALEAFPVGSQPRADQLGRAWEFFEHELHHHHDVEERFFWPALEQTDADLGSMAELDDEHRAMRDALDLASLSMQDLRADPTAARIDAARSAVAGLRTVLLDHLAHEERDLEPIAAAYADAPSVRAALAQVRKTNLRNLGNFVEWVQDGADDADRAGLRQEIPPPVVFVFGRLGGRRYRREIAPTWQAG